MPAPPATLLPAMHVPAPTPIPMVHVPFFPFHDTPRIGRTSASHSGRVLPTQPSSAWSSA